MRQFLYRSIATVFVGLLAYLSLIQIDGNIASDAASQNQKVIARTVFPQGWNFFTKPPTDSYLVMYSVEDDTSLELQVHESSSPNAAFGISRNMRSRGIELGHLAPQVGHDDGWHECDGGVESCLTYEADQAIEAVNPVDGAYFCGTYVMAKQKVTPRAYRTVTEERYRIEAFTSLQIACPAN